MVGALFRRGDCGTRGRGTLPVGDANAKFPYHGRSLRRPGLLNGLLPPNDWIEATLHSQRTGCGEVLFTKVLGYPCNRSCPTPWLSTGGSPEAAPSSAGTHAPAAALAGLSEVDGWRLRKLHPSGRCA